MQCSYENENSLQIRWSILNKYEYFSTLDKKSQPFTTPPHIPVAPLQESYTWEKHSK